MDAHAGEISTGSFVRPTSSGLPPPRVMAAAAAVVGSTTTPPQANPRWTPIVTRTWITVSVVVVYQD